MIMRRLIFLLMTIVISSVIIASGTLPGQKKLKVPERGFISSEQVKTWEEGLISGNGTIGINILSRPLDETIIFSHERLFLPKGAPTMPPDNANRLFK